MPGIEKITYNNGLEGLLSNLPRFLPSFLSSGLFLAAARFFPTFLLSTTSSTTNKGALHLPTGDLANKDGDDESGTEKQESYSYRGNVLVAVPENDRSLRNKIIKELRENNYRVVVATTGSNVERIITDYSLDTIVASTQIENRIENTAEIFARIKNVDNLLTAYFLCPGLLSHTEFAGNYENSHGFMMLPVLRDPKTESRKFSELIEEVHDAINNPRNGTRSQRMAFYSRLRQHWEEVNNYPKFINDHPERRDSNPLQATPELGRWMEYRYFRIPDEGGSVIGIREDSIEGVITAPVFIPIDPEKVYTGNEGFFAYIIKRINSPEEFMRYLEDSRIRTDSRTGLHFSRPVKYHIVDEETVLALFKMHLAPTYAKVMTKLNAKGGEIGKRIVHAIVDNSLERVISFLNRTRDEVDLSESALEEAKNIYSSRLGDALVYAAAHSGLALNEGTIREVRGKFDESLDAIIKRETGHARVFGRILDNSPYNSGPEIGVLDPDVNYIISKFGSSLDRIKDRERAVSRIWDQYVTANSAGKIQPRHIFEDFFHMVDSYEADLSEKQKTDEYSDFMRLLFRDHFGILKINSEALNHYWLDFFTIGTYRNLRKQHLVLSQYAVNNEELWEHFKIGDMRAYENKREDYIRKGEHYAEHAMKYAAVGEVFLAELYNQRSFSQNVSRVAALMGSYMNNPLDFEASEKVATKVPALKDAQSY